MCRECAMAIEKIRPCIEENTRYLAQLYKEALEEKKRRQASIIGDIDEFFEDNNNIVLNVQPQTRNLIRVTAVITQITSNGTLTVGNRVYQLASGIYPWFGLHWILKPEDTRKLTQTSNGYMSLELMGESLVDTGVW